MNKTFKTKKYKITFVEEITNEVVVEAMSLEQAEKIVNQGAFDNEDIVDRDGFQITDIHEVSSC